MRTVHPRLAPPSWMRLPRRSARLRLTFLYGGLFLLCGVVLLTVTYLLSEQAIDHDQAAEIPLINPVPPAAQPTLGRRGAAALAAAEHALAAQRGLDLHNLLVNSIVAFLLVALLAILLGWYIAGRVLRPVRTITNTARRISATNLHERLALDNADDEFKDLGDTLDNLFARLEASFDAQRHFVANASHELRTPIAAERAMLQAVLDDRDATADTWRSTSQKIIASNRKQEGLIDSLLALASSEGGSERWERIDLASLCDGVVQRRYAEAEARGLQIETTINPAAVVGDPGLIEHLVVNLVDNVIKHSGVGGHIQISIDTKDNRAVLTLTNTGPVIAASDIDRLFQPFQRLDPRRSHHKSGYGLGLSIVQAIATAHGAAITAHPEPRGGLSVTVTFPTPGDQCSDLSAPPQRPDADHTASMTNEMRQPVGSGHTDVQRATDVVKHSHGGRRSS